MRKGFCPFRASFPFPLYPGRCPGLIAHWPFRPPAMIHPKLLSLHITEHGQWLCERTDRQERTRPMPDAKRHQHLRMNKTRRKICAQFVHKNKTVHNLFTKTKLCTILQELRKSWCFLCLDVFISPPPFFPLWIYTPFCVGTPSRRWPSNE